MCENADKYRGFQIFETLLVVLNVDGSSPSGHPSRRHRRKAMSFFVRSHNNDIAE